MVFCAKEWQNTGEIITFACVLQVWPGESVYPDYLSAPNITSWLTKELKQFYDQVPFDGLWLDMCEASNFCTGMNCKQDRKNATATYCKLLSLYPGDCVWKE